MKPKIVYPTIFLAGAVLLMVCLTGCKDMFTDPLKDKDTGDKLTLLIMDRNFIKTTIAIRLEDMDTRKMVDQEEVTVWLLGEDSSTFIAFDGYKENPFKTSSGFVEVGCDPNRVINAGKPLEFTIVASSNGYMSPPQFVSYTTEGIKTLTVDMIPMAPGQSLIKGAYSEPYDISFNGTLNSGSLSFIRDISALPTGSAYNYINYYLNKSVGPMVCSNLKDPALFSDYGFYFTQRQAYGTRCMPPDNPIKETELKVLNYDIFTTALPSGRAKCDQGLAIITKKSDGGPGTGVFDYLITFSNGETKKGQIVSSFPDTTLIEQIYYPSSNPAVSVALSGDSQYDMSPAVNLSSACGNVAEFTATAKSNLKAYKFVTLYTCPDSEGVGIGISIMGEFRKCGVPETDAWTIFEFVEGICALQLEPDAEYDFRMNVDTEYHYFMLPTNPDDIPAALDVQSINYKLIGCSISTSGNMTVVSAQVQFTTGICELIE